MKFLVIAIAVSLAVAGNAQAGRGADDLYREMLPVKRSIEMTPEQSELFQLALDNIRRLPDTTSTTKSQLREIIDRALEKPGTTVADLQRDVLSSYFGVLEKTVQAHYELAQDWSRFDNSLSIDKRKVFRSTISEMIQQKFKDMTAGSERSTRTENFDTDDYAKKFGYSDEQRVLIRLLMQQREAIMATAQARRDELQPKIRRALQDPQVPFTEVAESMAESFRIGRETMTALLAVSSECNQVLDLRQQTMMADLYRGKLKTLRFFVSK